MKPKFKNPLQKVLWYVLYIGSAIAAGLSIFFYEIERINMATLAAIIVVMLAIYAALYWWAYRSSRRAAEEKVLNARKNRSDSGTNNDPEAAQPINIYDIKVHNSPQKIIMEVLTVLLNIAAWVMLWVQHNLDWDHIRIALVISVASLGALLAARFPFMMGDAEEHKDLDQISHSVKKHQLLALIFSIVAVIWPLFDFQYTLLTALGVYVIVEMIFSRKDKTGMSFEQQNQDRLITGQDGKESFKLSDIQVGRNTETLAFEVVTGIILVATMCVLLLSLDVVKSNFMGCATRLLFILFTASLAVNQVVRAVKFAKIDDQVTNTRQLRLSIRESRFYGVAFAITSLLLAIGIKHFIIDSVILIIVILAMFVATFFIFRHLIKKAQ